MSYIFVDSRGGGADEEGDLADESRHTKELLALLKQEAGDHPVFETYCSAFEDHYGDQYDWQGDTTTHRYLCRLLYIYYNQNVRGMFNLRPSTASDHSQIFSVYT